MVNTVNNAGNSVQPFAGSRHCLGEMHLDLKADALSDRPANERTNSETISPHSLKSDETDPFFAQRSGSDVTTPPVSPEAVKTEITVVGRQSQNTHVARDTNQTGEMAPEDLNVVSAAAFAGPSRSGSVDPDFLGLSGLSIASARTLVEEPPSDGVDRHASASQAAIAYIFSQAPQSLKITILSAAGSFLVPGEPRRPEQEEIARAYVLASREAQLKALPIH
ncbi:hypothetical protein BT69DRAFT_1297348 [Atractiella rhizophila]|nr:hypothetical protein BT69DRAFT_1297348 [Atractiella rhizophila]